MNASFRTLVLATASAAMCLGLAGSGLAADPIPLRVADTFPATHFMPQFATKWWMDEVAKATEHQVKFEYFGGGQLGKLADMLSLTSSGVADVGYIAPSSVSDKMPLSGVAELPGGYTTSCQGSKAFLKIATSDVLSEAEYKKLGVRVLFLVVLPPYQALAAKPFKTIEDLRGRKLRSAGGPQDLMVRNMGAVPVRVAATEQYESLSRGTIDGSIYPLPSVMSYDLQKLLPFSTAGANFGSGTILYAISERKLAALPEKVRTAMIDVGRLATERACAMLDDDNTATIEKLKQVGTTFVQLTPADNKTLETLAATVGEDWAKGMDQRRLPGSETLSAFKKAMPAH